MKKIIFLLAISAITYLSAGFYFKLYSIYDVFNKLKSLDYKVIISGNLYEKFAIVAIGILILIILIFTLKILIRKKPKKEIIKNNQMNLDFVFNSSDHLRYENGRHVSGPFGGAGRAVKVEPNVNGCEGYNIQGGEGYIVTVFNLDGNHPVWNSNVQVTPKPMKIISQSSEKIVLRGYQVEAMSPFGWIDFNGADYGLSIFLKNGQLHKCTLHMHDRGVDIEYLP